MRKKSDMTFGEKFRYVFFSIRPWHIILTVGIIFTAVVVISAWRFFADFYADKADFSDYSDGIDEVVATIYDNYEIDSIFSLHDRDGNLVDTVTIVKTENEGVVVFENLEDESSGEKSLYKYVNHLMAGKDYYVRQNKPDGKYLGFRLYRIVEELPDEIECGVFFNYNGKQAIFTLVYYGDELPAGAEETKID